MTMKFGRSNKDELRFLAWDEYVKDKPILKDMMGEMAQGLLALKKNQEAMHERQEKMWADITTITERLETR